MRSLIPPDISNAILVQEWRHGIPILAVAFPDQWRDIWTRFAGSLLRSDILKPGGSKSDISGKIDGALTTAAGRKRPSTRKSLWMAPRILRRRMQSIATRIGSRSKSSGTTRIRSTIAIHNFRLLFELRVIDVGVIVTRATELQTIFNSLGKGSSYGNSTTHFAKLLPRIEGGGGGGCPIVAFAIKKECYVDDSQQ